MTEMLGYLQEVREAYLDRYRRAIEQLREKGACTTEVWVQPDRQPGSDEPDPGPVCIDILCDHDEPKMVMVSAAEAPEGELKGIWEVNGVGARVYPFTWELCIAWARIVEPDWSGLDAWRQRWMNPNAVGEDGDDFAGIAHYIGPPIAEGGGYLIELDLGSAPVHALAEFVEALVAMGATELELGQSDGTDMDPDIAAELVKPDLTLRRLTELLAELLRRLPEVRQAQAIKDDEVQITVGDSDKNLVFAGNLFMRLQRTGIEARVPEVRGFLRGQRESMAERGPPDLSQLRPVIKDRRFLGQFPDAPTSPRMELVTKPLAADLFVCCVWDETRGMRYAIPSEAEQYGLSADQLYQRAIDNYRAIRQTDPSVDLVEHGPLLVARTGDSYDASLLLDDAFWERMAEKVQGELLVCVPARDVVLIGGSDRPETVAAFRKIAADVEAGGDHLISATILVRTADGRWAGHEIDPAALPPPLPASPTLPQADRKRPWWRFW